MRKSNKEHLYKAAFRVFLSKRFERVTISDIEKESGMTRGAVFYYAKTKLDLFKQVVEEYVVDYQNFKYKVSLPKDATLKDVIESYIKGISETIHNLNEQIGTLPEENGSSAYLNLIVQIKTYYPDLNERYLSNLDTELTQWISYIQRAIDNDEIRSDINVLYTAKTLINIIYGQSFIDAMYKGLDLRILRGLLENLYHVLQKQDS